MADNYSPGPSSSPNNGNTQKKNSRKRQRRLDNPLSVARGKKRAESLWHRKSGAGFALFCQFYARHVQAVCCGSGDKDDSSGDAPQASSSAQQPASVSNHNGRLGGRGGGLSRAAIRRRKKKKGKYQADDNANVSSSIIIASQDDTSTATTKTTTRSLLQPHPPFNSKLLAALEKLNDDPVCRNDSFRSFLVALSNPLPLTFRLRRRASSSKEEEMHKETRDHIKLQQTIKHQFASWVAPLEFDKCIYQAKCGTVLSKETLGTKSPALKEFLVTQAQQGVVARQELGSMLPVLALTRGGYIVPGSRVLDLCASPGSKTLQALEVVGVSGRIKANDINESRLDALRQAVERSGVPHAHRIKYTTHDASQYPIPPRRRLFDAVICDVPCSGDGTIRKDAHILPGWTPNTSNALHALQVRILKRALECVKVGGVVSYSTCSLNPVEDEAVICAVLAANDKEKSSEQTFVQLADFPVMRDLCARPGVQHWQVADYHGDDEDDDEPRLRWHDTFQQATDQDMQHACTTMWPPTVVPTDLQKCVRLHPQDHDSGGFFVALLKRRR